MKLRKKKTGEIGELVSNNRTLIYVDNVPKYEYNSLLDIYAEWEDYEEKGWYITENGEVRENRSAGIVEEESEYREIGNYFKTKEEAEKAVEKLKAWKRLKDAGFKFYEKWDSKSPEGPFYYVNIFAKIDPVPDSPDFMKDLDLLFGGEE